MEFAERIYPQDGGGTAVAALLAEAKLGETRPPFNDLVAAAYCQALPEVMARLPHYAGVVERFVSEDQTGNVSFRLNKLIKSNHALFVQQENPLREEFGYPDAFCDADKWLDFIVTAMDSADSPLFRQFSHNLCDLTLQTNRPARAKVIGMLTVARLLGDGDRTPPVIYDLGAANNNILKQLATRHDYPYPTTVVDKKYHDIDTPTKFFDMQLKMAQFSTGIGIEKAPPKTQADKDWIKALTLNPLQLDRDRKSEARILQARTRDNRESTRFEENYDLLDVAELPDNVQMIEDDVLHLSTDHRLLLDGRADLVLASHFLPQNEGHIDAIVAKMISFARWGAHLVIHDYVRIDPDDPQKISILPHWYNEPWLCQTIVLDMRRPDRGWFSVFKWETSDLATVQVQPAIGRMARELEAFSETR